jgi:nicotinamidase-related amidase
MATIREGNKTALLVVDVQVGVMRTAYNAEKVVSNIVKAVAKARAQGVPVIWVQHADEDLVYGSDDWQWVPELVPAEGETRVYKQYNSSFEETTLSDILRDLGVSRVVLCGAATNWCIRATAYGAIDRGYDLTLLKDAHTTETMDLDNGLKVEAASMIIDLNIAMQYLSYPGRVNGTVSAEELTFAP